MPFVIEYFVGPKQILDERKINKAKRGKFRKYSFKFQDLPISGAESRGRRQGQEDRVDINEIEGFNLLSVQAQDHVILETVKQIQKSTLENTESGSCLLTCIVTPLKNSNQFQITTINLGDSEAIITDVGLNKFNMRVLNRSHYLDRKPLINKTGTLLLNISHTIGDNSYKHVQHKPEIRRIIITTDPETSTNLLLFCDGIREQSMLRLQLEQRLRSQFNSPLLLADAIVDDAFQSNSGDNLSVLSFYLDPKLQLKHPIALSIYDGHGGAEISEYLRQNFLTLLASNVKAKLTAKAGCFDFFKRSFVCKNPELADDKRQQWQNR